MAGVVLNAVENWLDEEIIGFEPEVGYSVFKEYEFGFEGVTSVTSKLPPLLCPLNHCFVKMNIRIKKRRQQWCKRPLQSSSPHPITSAEHRQIALRYTRTGGSGRLGSICEKPSFASGQKLFLKGRKPPPVLL